MAKGKGTPKKNKGSQLEARKSGSKLKGMKGKASDPKANADKKTHRYRPGTVAIREIKKYQKYEDQRLTQKAPLIRRIRDQIKAFNPDFRLAATAADAIHEAVESYLVNMLEDANLCAIHAKRQTLFKKDVQLALKIRGDEARTYF